MYMTQIADLSSREKLKLILELSSEISATDSIRTMLQKITDGVKRTLTADRCTVFLLDEGKKELYSWVAHGLEGVEIRLPVFEGLAGDVASTGRTVKIEDAYSDSRFNAEFDVKTGYKTKTVLCMPMKNQKGKVIGVFQVLNKEDGVFSSEDEELLTLFSGQASAILESALLYRELKKTFVSFIRTLSEAIDARDPETAGHSLRVGNYAVQIAKNLGYDKERLEVLEYAAILHDLGKIGVKEAVLTKPGKLTEEEYMHIQSHAEKTGKILEKIYFQPEYREIPAAAALHHENVDGSGYPLKKKKSEIPHMAKIIAVADVFDSLTYERYYRRPMTFERVIETIKNDSGKKLDPECVNVFLNLKVSVVLKILTQGNKREVPSQAFNQLKALTVDELSAELKEKKDFPLRKIFNKYYISGEKDED